MSAWVLALSLVGFVGCDEQANEDEEVDDQSDGKADEFDESGPTEEELYEIEPEADDPFDGIGFVGFTDGLGIRNGYLLAGEELETAIALVNSGAAEELQAYLGDLPTDPIAAEDTDEGTVAFRGVGVCVVSTAVVSQHIRSRHVGKSAAQLKDRARNKGGTASSWTTSDDAFRALRSVITNQCRNMLSWGSEPGYGRKAFRSGNVGVKGLACNASSCWNPYGGEVIYEKLSAGQGFHVSRIKTGYPA